MKDTVKRNSMAGTQGDAAHAEPINLTKRIGSTNYRVTIHFSKTSRETMNDKIICLIKNDVAVGKAAGE